MSIAGKRVLITGPARGIGAETARQLVARGAQVALVGMEPERLKALAEGFGPGHFWCQCDVANSKSVSDAVHASLRALGGLDVVVANAGIATNGTVAITPLDALLKTVDVNLNGVIRTIVATLPAITESKGYYLLVSSASALKSVPGNTVYAATKIGVDHLANGLRLELAHHGVEVGVVYPAWVKTDIVLDQMRDNANFDAARRKMPWPFSTLTEAEDCARAMVVAIEKRRRKTYVPGALAPLAAVRQLFMSRVWEFFVKREAAKTLPHMEREIRALGRPFGSTSVGLAMLNDDRPDRSI